LRSLVVREAFGTLPFGPRRHLLTVSFESEQRNSVAARVADPSDVDSDHRADAQRWHGRKALKQVCEPRTARLDHRGAAMQPNDVRRTLERAEHDDDSSILAYVRDGLDAAADKIDIGHGSGAEHRKRVQ